jgi:predicted exporter
MTVYTDPPRVAILGVEALIGVAVLALLLPRSPQTPNLNLIPIIH